jgi:hypothetical protein
MVRWGLVHKPCKIVLLRMLDQSTNSAILANAIAWRVVTCVPAAVIRFHSYQTCRALTCRLAVLQTELALSISTQPYPSNAYPSRTPCPLRVNCQLWSTGAVAPSLAVVQPCAVSGLGSSTPKAPNKQPSHTPSSNGFVTAPSPAPVQPCAALGLGSSRPPYPCSTYPCPDTEAETAVAAALTCRCAVLRRTWPWQQPAAGRGSTQRHV